MIQRNICSQATAIICTMMLVLGMLFPHLLPAKQRNDANGQIVHSDLGAGNIPNFPLPFDDRDADPERDLPDSCERELEKDFEGLRCFVERYQQTCLQHILTHHACSHGAGSMDGTGSLPAYLILHTLLI
jgi:hypothetical protein